MRVALSVSTVGHAAIIGWGLVSLNGVDPYETTLQPPLPIDIVSIAEFTEITAGTRDGDRELEPTPPEPVEEAEPVEQPEPDPKPEAVEAPLPEPVPLRTAALTPDDPEPVPDPEPVAEAEPEPEPTPEPLADAPIPRLKPKPPARPQPAVAETKPEPDRFNADNIAALLNKIPESGGASPTTTGSLTPSLGTASGTGGTLTVSEIDALRGQISRCWSPPVAVLDAGELRVRVGMTLNQDGTLSRPPELLNPSSDPIFNVAAEAAIRAINRCQPYYLPPEKFHVWQQVNLTFDPKELLGG